MCLPAYNGRNRWPHLPISGDAGKCSFTVVTVLAVAVSHPNDLTTYVLMRREYVIPKLVHILTTMYIYQRNINNIEKISTTLPTMQDKELLLVPLLSRRLTLKSIFNTTFYAFLTLQRHSTHDSPVQVCSVFRSNGTWGPSVERSMRNNALGSYWHNNDLNATMHWEHIGGGIK
jgi:hypothetical protein